MKKQLRLLVILLLALLALGGGVWLLLGTPPDEGEGEAPPALSERGMMDVLQVDVSNAHSTYTLKQEAENSFSLGDLPAEEINVEYLQMLLDEASMVTYTEVVEQNPKDLSIYGLDQPQSRVRIAYTDGKSLTLLIGAEEPVSGGQYVMEEGGPVLLMPHNRTIRFTMPVEKYIDYIIVPFCELSSPLSAIKDITFAGSAFPEPVELRAVTSEDEALARTASSFGAATHLVVSPGLHEINQSECIELFQSVVGILSEGVVDYNCTEEELAAYGFDDPLLDIEYDWSNGRAAPVEHIRLRVAKHGGDYLLVRDGSGTVHRIRDDEVMLHTSYEKIVMRWFFTPFITDLTGLTLTVDGKTYEFEFTGETNAELGVNTGGKALQTDAFRKFYTLLVSASHDGGYRPGAQPSGALRMELVLRYRDEQKPDDVLRLYNDEPRRCLVEMNGVCEFTMLEKYSTVVAAALQNLLAGTEFDTTW